MKKIFYLSVLFILFFNKISAQETRIVSYFDVKSNRSYYLAWDTKTGKNRQYYWNNGKWEQMEINLPQTPLSGATGKIMFDVCYSHKFEQAYYIVWDTKTGRNTQYYWNDGKWSETQINLPSDPLPGAKGELMIQPHYNMRYDLTYYLVYDTQSGKSIQYYWSDGEWASTSINLPENPLK